MVDDFLENFVVVTSVTLGDFCGDAVHVGCPCGDVDSGVCKPRVHVCAGGLGVDVETGGGDDTVNSYVNTRRFEVE